MSNKAVFHFFLLIFLCACGGQVPPDATPDIITEKTLHDTDDPAIWVHPENPAQSVIFGTDKDTDGAIYAFGLDGKVIENKTLRNLKRPNNVDIEYGFAINDSVSTDIMVFTERERNQIRIFSVPDMKPLDQGGVPVFKDEKNPDYRLPMGISLYKSPIDQAVYAFVGRKSGPATGYIYQYVLESKGNGSLSARLVRKFGKFSGKKEIEAIAVDDLNGFVYYADEGVCIRKYHADPALGNEEISCFGGEYFEQDIEGIALTTWPESENYLIVSDQQRNQFNIFSARDNSFVKSINLGTVDTDGCEVTTIGLGTRFPNGLFVAMHNEREFFFYDLKMLGLP
ncbi:phytase [Poritiphilus flavus]|uniref:Phytase n=1 Tax=Poritiphilus flavus TaxID=2697053 RepID=A0A6L9ED02_9FLAO|nr:phytase [Poritiphilus flavus]NAS12630.1 phytase [Poritiphilus flavus]